MNQILNIQPNSLKIDLVVELEKYQQLKGCSWNEIANRTTVSSSILSQWRKNNYKGDNQEVNKTIERFLRIERSKQYATRKELEIVEITNTRKIIDVFKTVHRDGIVAAIVGDTGTSKTTSINKYEEDNDVVRISANRSFKFPIEYLRRIHTHKKIGKDGRGTMNKLFQDIVNELKGKNIILIVDQADYLGLSAIDIFRSLYDESGVGIVFVGLPSFLGTLRGNQPEVRQISDRIRLKLELKSYSKNDCNNILNQNWPDAQSLKEEFYKSSNGSLRVLSALVYHCKRIAGSEKNLNKKLDTNIIKKASRLLEKATLS